MAFIIRLFPPLSPLSLAPVYAAQLSELISRRTTIANRNENEWKLFALLCVCVWSAFVKYAAAAAV